VILAHNFQVPEVQDVAHYVGDSARPQPRGAKAEGSTIVFCGVHFMAETASILAREDVLIPTLRRLLAGRLDHAAAAQAWQAKHPGAVTVMYVNTTAEIKALTDYCVTSSNAVTWSSHPRPHARDTEILFGPDMFLGAYVEKEIGRQVHVWDGECHVHAGHPPVGHRGHARRAPGRGLPHPPRVRLLDLGHGVRAAGDVDARACTCSRRAGCSTTPRTPSPARR
jgi:quinolinate synthase